MAQMLLLNKCVVLSRCRNALFFCAFHSVSLVLKYTLRRFLGSSQVAGTWVPRNLVPSKPVAFGPSHFATQRQQSSWSTVHVKNTRKVFWVPSRGSNPRPSAYKTKNRIHGTTGARLEWVYKNLIFFKHPITHPIAGRFKANHTILHLAPHNKAGSQLVFLAAAKVECNVGPGFYFFLLVW